MVPAVSRWEDSHNRAHAACLNTFGDPPQCPDGIGPNGVYITARFATENSGYCASWESPAAARGFMACTTPHYGFTPNGSTCTQFAVKKGNMMAPSTGVFMFKRARCTSSECKVVKYGRCFDVSPEKPFKHCESAHDGCVYTDGNSYQANKLEKDTRAFAKLVLVRLKAGTAKDCKGNDLVIAQNMIKLY